VRAVVFVAAFQQDSDETPAALNAEYPGSLLTPENMIFRDYPDGQEAYLRPEKFAEVYAADVEPLESAVLAVAQHPFDPTALGGSFSGTASWRALPTWSIVATADKSIPTEALRSMAERAGSTVVEVDSSHAVPVAHPEAVADTIERAIAAVTPS
jgi:pimeloyl-ACP methyl ester carboxylesterase